MSEARRSPVPPPPGALNDAVPPSSSKWGHLWQHARHWLKSYVLYHFLAFVVAALLGGMAIAIIENSSYINGLYNATSALTVTGLTVFDFARVKLATQLVTFFLMILGSTSLVSVVPVVIRSVILSRRVPAIKAAADAERAHIELRAMRRLTVLLPLYMFANILFAFVATGFYTQFTTDLKPALRASNVGPWWTSLFISGASFANAGFAPFSDNLVPYRRSPFPLLVYAYLILAGNTWFPILLRLTLSIRVRLARLFRHGTEDYEYTLKYPRRVYTHLFPAHATWILVGVQTSLIVLQWTTAMGFEWHHNLAHLSPALKVVNTFFMAVSTRTAGFTTVNLATEAPPVQVMQLVMMYVSSLPVALSIRSSVDEAWAPDADHDSAPAAPPRPKRFRSLLRRALQRDLFLLVVAYWTISAIERDRIEPDGGAAPLSLFRILYELVSAYGTVGLSLSESATSLSASLRPASRLVLTAVMLAGRHRGLGLLLPLELDQALPRAGAPVAHAEVV